MRANSGKSTGTVADLRAEVRRWVNFLHAVIKTTSIDPSRSTLRTDTRMCSPLEKQADTSPSLDRFRFHRTELQLRLFHPPYCTPLLVIASIATEWLHYFAKQKKMGTKSSPNDDEEVLQLSEAIVRRVKWSYKSLLERRGLKMLGFFEKLGIENHLSRSPPGQSLCQWRQKGVLRPTSGGVAADFHDTQLKNQTSDRLRIGGNLLVTNISIDRESFISELSSPLK